MATKSKDIGTWFEKECEKHLKPLCLVKGRMFYKFPDTRSSRGLVPDQPGEFMILTPDNTLLLEMKASKKYDSFRSCMASMVRDSQYGWHKKWHLSGNTSLFVFYSDVTKSIELWNGRAVVEARSNKSPLEKEGYIIKIDLTSYSMESAMKLVLSFN